MRDLVVGMLLLSLISGCGSGDERPSAHQGGPAGEQPKAVATNPTPETVKVTIVPPAPVSGDCLTVAVNGRAGSRKISWFLDNELVQGDVVGQYCVPEGSRGKTVRMAFGENQDGLGVSVSIGNAPPIVLDAQMKLVVEGDRRYLECIPEAKDLDQDEIAFAYTWYVNGEPNRFESGNRLDIGDIKKGDLIRLEILPNDGSVDGPFYATLEGPLPGSPPSIVSQPPASFRANEFVYQVKAEDPDGDLLTYGLEKPPQGAAIDAGSGLLTWSLAGVAPGEYRLSIVVADPEGQKAGQEFSVNVTREEDGN